MYLIGAEQQLAAAYYRNTIIHFFVEPAIAELALLDAAEAERRGRVAAFWRAAMQLRDLLKFEFFFADKDAFRGELRRELAARDPNWEALLASGPEGAQELVRRSRPFNAHRVLRPFLEAYRVVADLLERTPPGEPIDEERFLDACLGLGQAVPPAAAHPQRRIGLEGAVRDRARAGRRTAGSSTRTEPELADWRRVFARGDPHRAAPHRRRRRARREPPRGADRLGQAPPERC